MYPYPTVVGIGVTQVKRQQLEINLLINSLSAHIGSFPTRTTELDLHNKGYSLGVVEAHRMMSLLKPQLFGG